MTDSENEHIILEKSDFYCFADELFFFASSEEELIEKLKMKFSKNSIKEIETCHADLVRLFNEVIEVTPLDFSIVQGARTVEQARRISRKGHPS